MKFLKRAVCPWEAGSSQNLTMIMPSSMLWPTCFQAKFERHIRWTCLRDDAGSLSGRRGTSTSSTIVPLRPGGRHSFEYNANLSWPAPYDATSLALRSFVGRDYKHELRRYQGDFIDLKA